MATAAKAKGMENLSFEDALKELESIVRKLESGESALENAIEDYTRGTALKSHCEQKLQDARLKVEKIVQQPDGRLATEPMESE
jgi:exodeoxyribonuclease VII small subunit